MSYRLQTIGALSITRYIPASKLSYSIFVTRHRTRKAPAANTAITSGPRMPIIAALSGVMLTTAKTSASTTAPAAAMPMTRAALPRLDFF